VVPFLFAVDHHGACARSPAKAPEQQVVHVSDLLGSEKAEAALHRSRVPGPAADRPGSFASSKQRLDFLLTSLGKFAQSDE